MPWSNFTIVEENLYWLKESFPHKRAIGKWLEVYFPKFCTNLLQVNTNGYQSIPNELFAKANFAITKTSLIKDNQQFNK